MDDTTITEADLLRALEEATTSAENPEGALTVAELSGLTGQPSQQIRDNLMVLKQAGRLEVTRVTRLDLADRQMRVPAYRLKQRQAHE